MFLSADGLSRIIGFDSQLIFDALITGINVFILFFALSYFLFNPIQDALKSRAEKIKAELENAHKKEEDAIKLKEEYESKLAETRKTIDTMIEDAKKNAKVMADDIVKNAKDESAKMIANANKQIEQERIKAVDDLKTQVVGIATVLATKVVKENVNTEKEDKLFKETIAEIGEAIWQD